MRYLLLTVGAPGVGKSTWIDKNQLRPYAIEPDAIRLLYQAPSIDVSGRPFISQNNDRKVWADVMRFVEERMRRGDLIVVDATHSRSKAINQYKKLADKYRYRIIAVDFREVVSKETLKKRNRLRPSYKRVKDEVIDMMWERFQHLKIPSGVMVIKPSDSIHDLFLPYIGYESAKAVVCIGDIHGQVNELRRLIDSICGEIKEPHFIFCGDYFDRGEDPAGTFRALQEIADRFPCVFLQGNHEDHRFFSYRDFWLGKHHGDEEKLAAVRETVGAAMYHTFEEFYRSGIDYKEVLAFYRKLLQCSYFTYGGYQYIVTHGGLPVMPDIFTPAELFLRGVGKYEDSEEVDRNFSARYMLCRSIHGHRNIFKVPVHNTNNTWNLDGGVEFAGGELRAVVFFKNGDHKEFVVKTSATKLNPRAIQKIDKLDSSGSILDTMRSHAFVKVKELPKNIYSCQFTRKAFKGKKWDAATIRARGLFIGLDSDGKEYVLVRGFEKFFNINERPETQLMELFKAQYPCRVQLKENGFLGLLSVDKRPEYRGEWIIASKSTTEGEYAGYFRELITPYLNDDLKQLILKHDVTLAFEVIDPKNDPHIVKYDKPKVVLLAAIRNTLDRFETLPLGSYGFLRHFKEIVEETTTLFSGEELKSFLDKQKSEDVLKPEGIEGYVLVFGDGFRVKYKTPWYSFWKRIRGLVQALPKLKDRPGAFVEWKNRSLHNYADTAVMEWLWTREDLWDKDIITIREAFFADRKEEK